MVRRKFGYRIRVSEGLTGVNRVVQLMRQRQYDVVWLKARTDQDTIWRAEFVVFTTEDDVQLLVRRPNRLPCVLRVLPWFSGGTSA